MPTTRKTKTKAQPRGQARLSFEWFPVFGLRSPDFPHAYVTGKTPEEALAHLAGFVSDEGRRTSTDYTVVFANEPFEIE